MRDVARHSTSEPPYLPAALPHSVGEGVDAAQDFMYVWHDVGAVHDERLRMEGGTCAAC